MAKRPQRKPAPEQAAALPAVIATEADLRAHVAALIAAQPHFGTVAAVAGPLPMRAIDPGFHGLFWIITGQQISVAAGRAIFARSEAALGTLTPENVAAAEDAVLKTAGMSAPKIRTLRAVSSAVLAGELDLAGMIALAPEEAIARLCAIKGIGPWTAEVYLLFALGHPDIFPAGDLALKEGVRLAFDLEERPSEKDLIQRAQDWSPHRSAAARLIWGYYGAVKFGKATAPV
jgi:DNA-3-methyladenine glycosylase II